VSDTVTLAYVHSTDVAHSFHDSLVNLLLFDASHEQRIIRGGYLPFRCGTEGLVAARNRIAAHFAASDADWLFVVDTDMGFAPDTLERLVRAADAVERPIVGALCFAWRELEPDGLSGYRCEPRPTIFDYVPSDDGRKFMGVSSYPLDEVVQCAGTGSACVLIHRSVFERIEAEYGSTWYDRITGDDGNKLGEDISFCVRAAGCGFPIHVHTGVKTTHCKTLWVGEPDFWNTLAVRAMNAVKTDAVPA
jgi:GT2 family glycosyltransferase